MDKIFDLVLSFLCISIPVGLLVASAIFGVKARRKYADELRKKLDAGYYNNWPKFPEHRRKIIAVFQAVTLVGLSLILVLWFVLPSIEMKIALVVVFAVLAILLIVLGLIMLNLLK